eukprot:gene6830-13835_t
MMKNEWKLTITNISNQRKVVKSLPRSQTKRLAVLSPRVIFEDKIKYGSIIIVIFVKTVEAMNMIFLRLLIVTLIVCCSAYRLDLSRKTSLRVQSLASKSVILRMGLSDDERTKKRIVRYDNVGDPVYEDDTSRDRGGINVLGYNVPFDPLSASLLIFGLIAFNFFVVANL